MVLSLCPIAASGQGIVNPAIAGNVVTAQIQLPGGISADLSLTFEQPAGLDLNTLGLSATLANPDLLATQGRLPGSGLVSLPSTFPVLLRVSPTGTSTLAFHGVYSISLHTENLPYSVTTPLRLFKAPDGGSFNDITEATAPGSYRVRGAGGTFSEFLILTDLRNLDAVINQKFNDLQAILDWNASAIDPSVLSTLRNRLTEARAAYVSGSIATSKQKIRDFMDMVAGQSGTGIPDVWRANSNLVNVAGLLRSAGSTLTFSLNLKVG
jgi:hypothetical protein